MSKSDARGKGSTYAGKREWRLAPAQRRSDPRRADWKKRNPIFVIQEHQSSHHHFDFRIEAGGVLVSWAVPKGPSTDPREKRLAVRVADHPLDYADFEGCIPAGQYGAGAVIVWDAGPYRLVGPERGRATVSEQVAAGALEIWLEGKKIRGGYALVHARTGGDDRNWLLIKLRDEGADARRNPVRSQRRSVLSGRTLAEVRREHA